MIKLVPSETLLYFDSPILIAAKDQIEREYICLLIDTHGDIDNFLCVPISGSKKDLLISGQIPIREVFDEPEIEDFFTANIKSGTFKEFEIQRINKELIQEDWLPERGQFLSAPIKTNDAVIIESKEKNRAIIHCTLNPPEAFEESKITANHLSEALRLFQRLIKFSYEKSLSTQKIIKQELMREASLEKQSTLEIFEFSPGSFTLHMQTAVPADLLGYSNISRAMEIIDAICEKIEDTPSSVEILSNFGGHIVTVYGDLLQFIVDTNTSFSYEWFMPSRKNTKKVTIIPRLAKNIHEAISEKKEIGNEIITLVGKFTKVDEETGKWRLVTDENKKFLGETFINLSGITIETQRYKIICEEKLETIQVTKRDIKKLYIQEFYPV